jgi:hypothetical protein
MQKKKIGGSAIWIPKNGDKSRRNLEGRMERIDKTRELVGQGCYANDYECVVRKVCQDRC